MVNPILRVYREYVLQARWQPVMLPRHILWIPLLLKRHQPRQIVFAVDTHERLVAAGVVGEDGMLAITRRGCHIFAQLIAKRAGPCLGGVIPSFPGEGGHSNKRISLLASEISDKENVHVTRRVPVRVGRVA